MSNKYFLYLNNQIVNVIVADEIFLQNLINDGIIDSYELIPPPIEEEIPDDNSIPYFG